MRIRLAWNTFWDEVNEAIADSRVGKYFQLRARNGLFSSEVRAGTVTFLTTAYILAVNAQILADTGGPCSPADCDPPGGPECVFPDEYGVSNPGYHHCLETTRKSLVTATAASSMFGCFLMGFGANLPIATAPGMGLNAYFAYTVVGYRGTGAVSYETALTAVFLEGLIFVLLATWGLRAKLIGLIPRSIMFAAGGGIGLYLAAIGLNRSQGLGVIAFDRTTLSTLGGCPPESQVPVYVIPHMEAICQLEEKSGHVTMKLPPPANVFACNGDKMAAGTVWLGLGGLAITAVLMSRSFKGSIIIGIIFVTVIAWIPGHDASFFGRSSPIPGGEARLAYFKRVVALPSLANTGLHLQFKGFGNGQLWIALMTFLYIDFLDTTGALISMTHFINQYVPGFLDHQRRFPRQTVAYTVDGFATMAGACMGTSPVAVFIESASGIREGGRTGITAIVVGFYFLISLFFTPILASVPPYAIGPALVTVGALMMMNVVRIKWDMASEALPAFLTIVIMPLTNSIAYGVIAGIVGFIFINGLNFIIDKITEFFEVNLRGTDELPQFTQNTFIRSLTSRTRPSSPTNSMHGGFSGPASRSESLEEEQAAPPRSWWERIVDHMFGPLRPDEDGRDLSNQDLNHRDQHSNGAATPASPRPSPQSSRGFRSSDILETPFSSLPGGSFTNTPRSPHLPSLGSGLVSEGSRLSSLGSRAFYSMNDIGEPARNVQGVGTEGSALPPRPPSFSAAPVPPKEPEAVSPYRPTGPSLQAIRAASPAPSGSVPRRGSIIDLIQNWDTLAKEAEGDSGRSSLAGDLLQTSESGPTPRTSSGRRSTDPFLRLSIERTTSAPEVAERAFRWPDRPDAGSGSGKKLGGEGGVAGTEQAREGSSTVAGAEGSGQVEGGAPGGEAGVEQVGVEGLQAMGPPASDPPAEVPTKPLKLS